MSFLRQKVPRTKRLLRFYSGLYIDFSSEIHMVPTDAIKLNHNLYNENELSFKKLIHSIRTHGQITPGLLRPVKSQLDEPYFEVVSGVRRAAVAQIIGDPFIACIKILTDQEAQALRKELQEF